MAKHRRIREQVFTWPSISACCAVCYRPPLRRLGREYLYRYGESWALVCGDVCAKGPPRQPTTSPAPRVTAQGAAMLISAFDPTDINRARAAGAEALRRHMASFIVTLTAGAGACSSRNLTSAGFTPAEIRLHGTAAIAIAGNTAPQLRGEFA